MIFLGKKVRNYGEPFIVAEISGNHGGDFSKALNLIDAAKWAGADAVKVQCYDADDLTIPNGYVIGGGTPWEGQTLYELYKEACTPKDWMRPLFNHARTIGIPIFSSVYSLDGLRILEEINCPAYKIASYEANDPYFIARVRKENKPIVISTGMLSEAELERAYEALGPNKDNAIFLHCVSKYPTEIDRLGLATLSTLMDTCCGCPIGFSCHSDDPTAVFAAVAHGAAMVEVHLALDDGDPQVDFEFSMLPDQLKWTVESSKKLHEAYRYKNDKLEEPAREFRRSLHIVKDIAEGEMFTEDHIKSCRPATGCEPRMLPNIIGRKAKQNLKAYTPMRMEYVE